MPETIQNLGPDGEVQAAADLLDEIRERAINIELKVDAVLESARRATGGYAGHADQMFGPSTFAQHGDDLVIINIFHNIGVKRPSYIDIGAHHPLNISNTPLLYNLGCRGINVEPNPNLIEKFFELRPEDCNLNVGVAGSPGELTFYMIDDFSGRNTFDKATAENFVSSHPEFSILSEIPIQVMTVNQIVETHAGGVFPDFMSIDVEGLDISVVQSMDCSKSKPKLICIEYITGDDIDRHEEIKAIMAGMDYFCAFKTVGNAFFVDSRYQRQMA